jgi:hypothetical protein
VNFWEALRAKGDVVSVLWMELLLNAHLCFGRTVAILPLVSLSLSPPLFLSPSLSLSPLSLSPSLSLSLSLTHR